MRERGGVGRWGGGGGGLGKPHTKRHTKTEVEGKEEPNIKELLRVAEGREKKMPQNLSF